MTYKTEENGDITFVDTCNEEKPRLLYNVLAKDLQNKLWKKKYDFKRSLTILAAVNKYCNATKTMKYNKNRGLVERQENKGLKSIDHFSDS